MYDALNNLFSIFGQHWMKKLIFVVTDWTSPPDCQESGEFTQECQNKDWFQQEFMLQFYYKAFVNVKQIHNDLPFVFFEALGDDDTQQQRWKKSANQLWQYVSQHERMHFRLIDEVLEAMVLMEQKMKEMEEGKFLKLLTIP